MYNERIGLNEIEIKINSEKRRKPNVCLPACRCRFISTYFVCWCTGLFRTHSISIIGHFNAISAVYWIASRTVVTINWFNAFHSQTFRMLKRKKIQFVQHSKVNGSRIEKKYLRIDEKQTSKQVDRSEVEEWK